MSNSTSPPGRYAAFGSCVIDRLRGLFWRESQLVPLTPKVFELLVTFVNNPGRLIARDELIERVWSGAIVEDNNIARHISTLRRALNERPQQHEYIATVPGVGYRFVATVTELEDLPAELAAASTLHPPTTDIASDGTSEGTETDAHPAPVPAPAPNSRRLWITFALAAPVLVIAAGAVTIALMRTRDTARTGSATTGVLQQFTYDRGLQQHPAWSRDGGRITYSSDHQGNADIWVQAVTHSEPLRITSHPAHDWEPDWSPDGQWIVFRSERDGGGLYVASARGGSERRLADFGVRPRWSPSGSLVLFLQASPNTAGSIRAYVVGLDGSTPRAVGHDALAGMRLTSASWHPDGRVSFWGRRNGEDWRLVTVAVDGGTAVESSLSKPALDVLTDARLRLSEFAWAPSGRFVFFQGRSGSVSSLWRVAVDPRTLSWTGGIDRLTTAPGIDAGFAVSPDGGRIAFGVNSGQSAVWSFGFDPSAGKLTSEGRPVTQGYSPEMGLDASVDGSTLVYRASRNERQEIWVQPIDGTPRLLLSSTEWTRTSPQWSPDGTRLAYRRSRRNADGAQVEHVVSVLALDRPEEQLVTTPSAGSINPTDWSADGTSLLAGCRPQPGEGSGICLLSIHDDAGGPPAIKVLSASDRFGLFQMRFSPDQRWISFIAARRDRGIATVHVMPAAGGPWTTITDGAWYDDKPRWAPDGRTLYFVSNRSGRAGVWGRRFDTSSGQPVGEAFLVTAFERTRQIPTPNFGQLDIVVSSTQIFVPMHEASGQLWILDQVDP